MQYLDAGSYDGDYINQNKNKKPSAKTDNVSSDNISTPVTVNTNYTSTSQVFPKKEDLSIPLTGPVAPSGNHSLNTESTTPTLARGEVASTEQGFGNFSISDLYKQENWDKVYEEIKVYNKNVDSILAKNGLNKSDIINILIRIKTNLSYKDQNLSKTYMNVLLKIFSVSNIQNNISNLNKISKQTGYNNFFEFLSNKAMKGEIYSYTGIDNKSNLYIKANVDFISFWESEILSNSPQKLSTEVVKQTNIKYLSEIIDRNNFFKNILKGAYGNDFKDKFFSNVSSEELQSPSFNYTLTVLASNNLIENNDDKKKYINTWEYKRLFEFLGINNDEKSKLLNEVINSKFGYKSEYLIKVLQSGGHNESLVGDLIVGNFLFGAEKYIQNNKHNFNKKDFIEYLNNSISLDGSIGNNLFSEIYGSEDSAFGLIEKLLQTNGINIDKNILNGIGQNKLAQRNEKIVSIAQILKYLNLDAPEDGHIKESIDKLCNLFDITTIEDRQTFKKILSQLSIRDFESPKLFVAGIMDLRNGLQDNLQVQSTNNPSNYSISNVINKKILSKLTDSNGFINGNENKIFDEMFILLSEIKIKTLDFNFDNKALEAKISQLLNEGKIPAGSNIELIRYGLKYCIRNNLNPNQIEQIFSDKNIQEKILIEYTKDRLEIVINQIESNPDLVSNNYKPKEVIKKIREILENPTKDNLLSLSNHIMILEANKNNLFLESLAQEIKDNLSEKGKLILTENLQILKSENISLLVESSSRYKQLYIEKVTNEIKSVKEGKTDWNEIFYENLSQDEIQTGSVLDKYSKSHETQIESFQAEALLSQKLLNTERGLTDTQPISYNLNYNPNEANFSLDGKNFSIKREGETIPQFKTKLNLIIPKLVGMPDFTLDGNTDELSKIFNLTSFELSNNDLKQTADKFGVIIFNLLDEKINNLAQNGGDLAQIDKLKEIRNEFFARGSLEGMRKFFNDIKQNGQPIKLQDFFSDSQIFGQIFSVKENNLHLEANKMAQYLEQNQLYSSMRIEKYYISKQLQVQNN